MRSIGEMRNVVGVELLLLQQEEEAPLTAAAAVSSRTGKWKRFLITP